jgi:hypothetical protein
MNTKNSGFHERRGIGDAWFGVLTHRILMR